MAKVLIAEDDALLSTILVKSLGEAGFEVRAANDGHSAEHQIDAWDPDVMLLDLMMPNEDGFAVLERMQTDGRSATIHTIVLSNLNSPEAIARVRDLGVSEYLTKANVTPTELIKKLRDILS